MRIALTGPVDPRSLQDWLDSPTERTGTGNTTIVDELATGMLRAGHDVTVVGLDPAVASVERYTGDGLTLYLCPFRPGRRARDAYRVERAGIRAALREARPDVIHAQWTYEYALAAMSCDAVTVITAHDWSPAIFRLLRSPYFFIKMLMSFAVLLRRPSMIVVSPYMADKYRRWSRPAPVIMPNPVADSFFVDRNDISVSSSDEPVVLAINASWDDRKNVATLLTAWPQVRRTFPGARLRLVGTTYELHGPAWQWADVRGLTEQVDFVGPVPHRELASELDGTDVFVHPSIEESFGLVLIEAMARGVPVVAGRESGGVPWVCADGAAADLVDVRSPSAVAEAIIRLLSDPERRLSMARAGFDNASERFRTSSLVDRHLSVYRLAIDRSSRRRRRLRKRTG